MDKDHLEDLMMYANSFMSLKALCFKYKGEGKSGEWIYHNVVVPTFADFDISFAERRMKYLLAQEDT